MTESREREKGEKRGGNPYVISRDDIDGSRTSCSPEFTTDNIWSIGPRNESLNYVVSFRRLDDRRPRFLGSRKVSRINLPNL